MRLRLIAKLRVPGTTASTEVDFYEEIRHRKISKGWINEPVGESRLVLLVSELGLMQIDSLDMAFRIRASQY